MHPPTRIGDLEIPTIVTTTVVVGTGSAGYAAADQLLLAAARRHQNQPDICLITDQIRAGTSRNAGSDKQTYYKLGLAGAAPDSVAELARTLFAGGAMDGDNALAEAAGSARAFLHLAEIGVPFPTDRHGQFTGYRTDHDPRERGTSIGPYTSKAMTECLEARVLAAGVPIRSDCRLLDLIVDRSGHAARVVGLLAYDRSPQAAEAAKTSPGGRFLLVRAGQVILATGGPAGIYADSVYPHGQWGATGAALRAGAPGRNLTEWQFGLASIAPRWNVSGSYLQVVPRIISTDAAGGDEREFLDAELPDATVRDQLVFLKGYQWPFDARKAACGSSVIDLLVHRERVLRGRRVWLDFRSNPGGGRFHIDRLHPEARDYLTRAGVAGLPADATPADRLRRLNQAAYDFYLDRGPRVDLAGEPLEIAVCAQHSNGGLEVDSWWRSPLSGLYAVGEVAASHGVYRPGGAALNSGQVGAARAACWLSEHGQHRPPDATRFAQAAAGPVQAAAELVALGAARFGSGQADNTEQILSAAAQSMSRAAGLVRSAAAIEQALELTRERLAEHTRTISIDPGSRRSMDRGFLIREILTSQYCHLGARRDYLARGGRSRGSVLYTDPAGELPGWLDAAGQRHDLDLPEQYRFRGDDRRLDGVTQVVTLTGTAHEPRLDCRWRPVRPLPCPDEPFEVVWRRHRLDRNVY